MDDNQFLSQEEIEALLKGSDSEEEESEESEEKDEKDEKEKETKEESIEETKKAKEKELKEEVIEEVQEESEGERVEAKEAKVERTEDVQTYQKSRVEGKDVKRKAISSKDRSSDNGKSNLDLILDIPLELSVILGSKNIELNNLLDINSGTLIELNKLVDEKVEIYVNGKLLAQGEIVAIDENFGVRITDIIRPVERLESLKK